MTLVRIAATLGLMVLAGSASAQTPSTIQVIGVENEYADVIRQVGGKAVHVEAILTDPNTDPHTFEASPKLAMAFSQAKLVVENGVGYDSWADKLMAASPNAERQVLNVQKLLNLPDDIENPHLWYDPKTMPVVAMAVADALAKLQPSEAATFHANAEAFVASLKPWMDSIAAFKAKYPDTPVATTEPVADYLLKAMGCKLMTPQTLEKAVMDGTDPAPQDITIQNELFSNHKVKIFVYNQQVTDALTASFLDAAQKAGVPVVGVYETMPTPGYTYQSWMQAEVEALTKAVADKTSTLSLQK
ncbi:metal ABC transporter solute-binding protein, Zn/Mn family [Aureimonas sp. D3]|uniref:metal ABC transporter solute-binding protein, Zn/Mn family n=1 Tax=Aureimonas sp. D3 TaxID=1638164 RepID=UPI0007849243|nr:zinc ABC transporter substrate-binding protein [Aureimonas sp. D3]